MEANLFEETEFFGALARSGARALLIGRRALIALGIPVLTADYDFWLHPDDVEAFNAAAAPFALRPNRSPAAARDAGRYVLENDQHVDVLIAKHVSMGQGAALSFEEVWSRRVTLQAADRAPVALPTIEDLIATKRFAARPKDAEDIRLLETLRERQARDP